MNIVGKVHSMIWNESCLDKCVLGQDCWEGLGPVSRMNVKRQIVGDWSGQFKTFFSSIAVWRVAQTEIDLWLGLRSSLTWHVKIHDFESIPKTKNKESSMFWDIIGVGIWNISTNEAFYAEKSSILRIINA